MPHEKVGFVEGFEWNERGNASWLFWEAAPSIMGSKRERTELFERTVDALIAEAGGARIMKIMSIDLSGYEHGKISNVQGSEFTDKEFVPDLEEQS